MRYGERWVGRWVGELVGQAMGGAVDGEQAVSFREGQRRSTEGKNAMYRRPRLDLLTYRLLTQKPVRRIP